MVTTQTETDFLKNVRHELTAGLFDAENFSADRRRSLYADDIAHFRAQFALHYAGEGILGRAQALARFNNFIDGVFAQ